MDRFSDTASSQHRRAQPDNRIARSYWEIAQILAEREGAPISPAEVRRMCRAAERKLARAMRDNLRISQRSRGRGVSPSRGSDTSSSVDDREAQHLLPRRRATNIRHKRTEAITSAQLTDNRCVFQVCCAAAQQVKLVISHCGSVPRIFSLRLRGEGMWETVLDLDPGEHRYCYHAYDGRSLTCLVPADAPLDGLKAVLCVGEASPLETRSRKDCI